MNKSTQVQLKMFLFNIFKCLPIYFLHFLNINMVNLDITFKVLQPCVIKFQCCLYNQMESLDYFLRSKMICVFRLDSELWYQYCWHYCQWYAGIVFWSNMLWNIYSEYSTAKWYLACVGIITIFPNGCY